MADETENLVPDDKSDEKEEVVVIIDDSKPEGEEGAAVVKPATDAASEGVDAITKNLAEAQKKADAESARAASAERRAEEAEAKVVGAESRISEELQRNIEANKTAATADQSAAKADYDKFIKEAAELSANGDFEKAEEARQNAFDARQRIKVATHYLEKVLPDSIEKLKSAPRTVQDGPKSDDKGTVDPVTGIKFTPKTYEWVSKQGDKWKDQDFRVVCDAATREAKRKNISPDTEEYFNLVEKRLQDQGFLDAPAAESEGDDVTEETPKPAAKPAVPAKKPAGAAAGAPPTRAVQGTSGVAKKGVKLSGEERAVAQAIVDSLPDVFGGQNPDQLYARNKAALIAEQGEDYGKQTSR